MEPPADLLTLLPPIDKRKKAPSHHNRNHLGAPSNTGSFPSGKASVEDVEGDSEADCSESGSSSSQEEDDADDENDEDDEEPAVDRPVTLIRKRKYTLTEEDGPHAAAYKMQAPEKAAKAQGDSKYAVNVAGFPSKGRAYSIGSSTNTLNSEFDAALTETDDEPDYPRKKTIRRLSDCEDLFSDFPTTTNSPDGLDSEMIADEINVDEDDDDDEGDRTSIDFDVLTAASDDDDIDLLEAEALAREFELDGPDSPVLTINSSALDMSFYDELLSDQDCFAEPGLLAADDPDAWTFPSGLLYHDGLISDDLFSVPVSREDSRTGSPTPRSRRIMSPLANPEVLHSDGWSDDDQLVEEDLQNPFFDREDPAVQHLVNSQWVATTWMEDSEDEDDAWKYCLSSDDSSEGEGDDESTQGVECGNNGDDSAEDEDSDSDATDDDEDLPLPTPLTLSKLKRLSSPTPESSQPQILQRDPENRNGPFLGSWVADPTRPICIIDGAKKTMLVPSNHKRFSIDSESSYHNIYSLLEETEFDSAVIFAQATPIFTYGVSNPTMAGFSVGAGGYLNGADMCGPPEAFNPRRDFSDFDELLREEYNDGNEDSVDEEEQMLSFEDILALSESEDEVDGSKQENQVAQTQESDAEVNRWQYIPVTSFRKRQQQHKQRLSGQLSYWNKGRSVMKPKLTSTDATMAPARRRKAAIIKTPYIKPAGLPKKRV